MLGGRLLEEEKEMTLKHVILNHGISYKLWLEQSP